MRVVVLDPSTASLTVIVVQDDESQPGKYELIFREEWKLDVGDRPKSLVTLRKRLLERLREEWKPDAVCIKPLEPMALKSGAQFSWFHTAEIRGVAAEAAASVCDATEFRYASTVSKTIGARKKQDYADDTAFWNDTFGTGVPKKYQAAVLIGVSRIRQETA